MIQKVDSPLYRPTLPDIEITPEMIEAGAQAIFAHQDDLMAWGLAEAVYRAMALARIHRQTNA